MTKMNPIAKLVLLVAAVFCGVVTRTSSASSTVTFGLTPVNITPTSFTVAVTVSETGGTVTATGMTLYITTQDGGIYAPTPTQAADGPVIKSVVYTTSGYLWASASIKSSSITNAAQDETGNGTTPSEGQIWQTGFTLNSGSVSIGTTSKTVELLTFDINAQTGFATNGTYGIYLTGSSDIAGTTSITGLSGTIAQSANSLTLSGFSSVGPEPASLGLLTVIIPGALLRRRRPRLSEIE